MDIQTALNGLLDLVRNEIFEILKKLGLWKIVQKVKGR